MNKPVLSYENAGLKTKKAARNLTRCAYERCQDKWGSKRRFHLDRQVEGKNKKRKIFAFGSNFVITQGPTVQILLTFSDGLRQSGQDFFPPRRCN